MDKHCTFIASDIFYIIKQDFHIHVEYCRPNGWTDWAEFFCGHSSVAGGMLKTKNSKTCFFSKKNWIFWNKKIFKFVFCHGQRRALQLVFYKCEKNIKYEARQCFHSFKIFLYLATWEEEDTDKIRLFLYFFTVHYFH